MVERMNKVLEEYIFYCKSKDLIHGFSEFHLKKQVLKTNTSPPKKTPILFFQHNFWKQDLSVYLLAMVFSPG